jgi:hypothetical protein
MELTDLEPDERTALVGLLKLAVMSDGNVSEDELERVEDIVDALGEEVYQNTLDTFETRFPDLPAFQKFLRGITRQEARELIYGTILEGSIADSVEGRESDLLTWLAEAWNVEVKIEGAPQGD